MVERRGYARTGCAGCEVSAVVAYKFHVVLGTRAVKGSSGNRRNAQNPTCKGLLDIVDLHADSPEVTAVPTCNSPHRSLAPCGKLHGQPSSQMLPKEK